MKAKEYASQFESSRLQRKDPELSLRIIFRDFIREANIQVLHRKCKKPEEISEIFSSQNAKWKEMCRILKRYRINKDGFLELLRDLQPNAYIGLVAHGLAPLNPKSEGGKNARTHKNRH